MSSDNKLLERYLTYLVDPTRVDSFEYTLFISFDLAVMAYLFYLMYYYLRQYRLIEDTPTSQIRSCAQGFAELKGRQRQLEDIVTPFTKTECTWWRYKIEEYRSSGKSSSWVTIEKKRSSKPFILFDSHDECIIHPAKAEIVSPLSKQWKGHYRYPQSTKNAITGRYRYTEEYYLPGSFLYALGMFRTMVVNKGNKDYQKYMNLWKKEYLAILKKYDTNKDNELDDNEWQNITKMADKEIFERHKQNISEQDMLEVNFLSGEGLPRRKYYILSNTREKDLVKSKKSSAHYSTIGFVIFLAHNLYAIAAVML